MQLIGLTEGESERRLCAKALPIIRLVQKNTRPGMRVDVAGSISLGSEIRGRRLRLIEGCIRIYRDAVTPTQRIMINFVEATRYDHFSTSDVIPVDEKSTINYPLFYKWANKYQTNETLFVNHNTGRIIHNVIVNYANGVKK